MVTFALLYWCGTELTISLRYTYIISVKTILLFSVCYHLGEAEGQIELRDGWK